MANKENKENNAAAQNDGGNTAGDAGYSSGDDQSSRSTVRGRGTNRDGSRRPSDQQSNSGQSRGGRNGGRGRGNGQQLQLVRSLQHVELTDDQDNVVGEGVRVPGGGQQDNVFVPHYKGLTSTVSFKSNLAGAHEALNMLNRLHPGAGFFHGQISKTDPRAYALFDRKMGFAQRRELEHATFTQTPKLLKRKPVARIEEISSDEEAASEPPAKKVDIGAQKDAQAKKGAREGAQKKAEAPADATAEPEGNAIVVECPACHKPGHTVAQCIWRSNNHDWFVHGCPICNVNGHLIDQCKQFLDAGGIQKWIHLVVNRSNMPGLALSDGTWYRAVAAEVAKIDLHAVTPFPWTPAFTRKVLTSRSVPEKDRSSIEASRRRVKNYAKTLKKGDLPRDYSLRTPEQFTACFGKDGCGALTQASNPASSASRPGLNPGAQAYAPGQGAQEAASQEPRFEIDWNADKAADQAADRYDQEDDEEYERGNESDAPMEPTGDGDRVLF